MSAGEHLSALALDALALGAAPPERARLAEAHLAACARCRADADASAAHRRRFDEVVLPRTGAAVAGVGRSSARWPAWPAFGVAAVALAAVAILVVVDRGEPGDRGAPRDVAGAVAPDLAVKGGGGPGASTAPGGPMLEAFVRHGDDVAPLAPDARLAAGDRLRFVVHPEGRPYLLLVSLDGEGKQTIYFPYGAAASGRLPPGARVELPGSIVLDAARGPERVFALFSVEPIAVASLAPELADLAARGPDALRVAGPLAPPRPDVAQATVAFDKEAP